MIYNIFMISSFILLILILISYYFVNSKEHLISTNSDGKKITYEGDVIRYTCGDTDQVIHNDDTPSAVIQSSHILDASIELNPSDNQGDVYYGTGNTANKIQCKCKNGFSIDPADSTKCICPKGKYITNGKCEDCASGRYTDEEDQTSCKYPVAGKRASTDKLKEIDCELGTWSNNSAARENCAKPPAGKYADATGLHDCAAGTWAATNNVARTACANPSSGSYANSSTSETECAAGTWASGNTTARTSCTEASNGYYVQSAGRWYQDACPAGKYQDETGQTSCKFPSAGKYANSTTGQTACPAGTFSSHSTLARGHGTTGCTPAYKGHYVPNNVRTYQATCGQGDYQPLTGQSSCYQCNSGSWRAFKGCGEAKHATAAWCGGAAGCATMIDHHKCENVNNAVKLPASGATHCLSQSGKDMAGNNNF